MKRVLFSVLIGILMFLGISFFAEAQAPISSILHGYSGQLNPAVSVTIAINTSASSAINQGGFTLVGCQFPAAFTGTTVTFTESSDGTNYFPVYNSSGAVSYTIAQGRYYAFNSADLQGIHYLKIISGSSEAAARTLICSLKGI